MERVVIRVVVVAIATGDEAIDEITRTGPADEFVESDRRQGVQARPHDATHSA